MKNILVFVSILIWACSCDDDSLKQLPPATQEGKNTFGCLVNGEVFLADKGGLFDSPISVEILPLYYFNVGGTGNVRNFDDPLKIQIYVNNKIIIGADKEINLGENKFQSGSISVYYGNEYWTYGENSGQLNISKIDSLNKIVSGTFHFDAKSEEGDLIEIRNGRFDITYEPARN